MCIVGHPSLESTILICWVMTITHDVSLNDHRHNDYHYDHHSPPNGTYCHSDLEESNNDFIQVFIISIIVFFPM